MEETLSRHRQREEGGSEHIGALFKLGKVKLALGQRAEADWLFEQAQELGRRKWGADNFQFEHLAKDIQQARATAIRPKS